MKVVEWIDPYEESPSPIPVDGRRADYFMFLHASDMPQEEKDRLGDEAWNAVKDEVREKGYKFTGMAHLTHPNCVPVLDNGMTVDVSVRAWGRLMFEAWHPGEANPLGYALYMNEVPSDEEEKLPSRRT